MMSLTFGLFTQVSGLGPLGPLVNFMALGMLERRRGRVVRAAWLWCRKSPYPVNSRLGYAMRRLENSVSTQQKMGTFFELGKDKAAKERDGLRLSSAVPKIQWVSNPHCPYGY